jgi:threonine/homoserine/homoserine lactone efflux protein
MKQAAFEEAPEMPRSLAKGIAANALSPHPYIFWLTVGTPIMSKAVKTSMALPFVFILGFYVCLIGAKILLAVLVGQSRAFLQGKTYVNTMRMLGVVMCVFALMLFKESLGLLGIL